jgi:hypothetical protein
MTYSKDLVQKTKKLMEEKSGKEVSEEEAEQATEQLARLAELLFDCWREDKRREKKLEEFPNGYTLDGVGYSCAICGSGTPKDGNWYDRWGIKCLICQGAINRKELPPSLAKSRDAWYTKFELERSFNLTTPVLKKWIKDDIIKVRNVMNENGRVHIQLFLLKDNKDFLPPKKMVESRSVSEEKDGQTWFRSYPWYRFVDPFEHLKGYRIMEYMQTTKNDDT